MKLNFTNGYVYMHGLELHFGKFKSYIPPMATNIAVSITKSGSHYYVTLIYTLGGSQITRYYSGTSTLHHGLSSLFLGSRHGFSPHFKPPARAKPLDASSQSTKAKPSSHVAEPTGEATPPPQRRGFFNWINFLLPPEFDIVKHGGPTSTALKNRSVQTLNEHTMHCLHFQDYRKDMVLKCDRVPLPLASNCTRFDICYIKTSTTTTSTNYKVVVISNIGEMWLESYYDIEDGTLKPASDFTPFATATFPSRLQPDKSSETIQADPAPRQTLNLFEPHLEIDTLEMDKCKVFRHVSNTNSQAKIGEIVFKNASVSVLDSQEFVMASTCSPFPPVTWVLVMLKYDWFYTSSIWYAAKNAIYKETRTHSLSTSMRTLSYTIGAWLEHDNPLPLSQTVTKCNSTKVSTQILCIDAIGNLEQRVPLCKPLDQLENFKLIASESGFTMYLYKKNSPKSLVVIGYALIELMPCSKDVTIYVTHEPNQRRQVLIRGYDTIKSMTETQVGSARFVPLQDAWDVNGPQTKREPIQLDLNTLATEAGTSWHRNPTSGHWIFAPPDHYEIESISLGHHVLPIKNLCSPYCAISIDSIPDPTRVLVHCISKNATQCYTLDNKGNLRVAEPNL
ncbi:hypothetical protein BdWA1_000123 [Babesia duncani]|uniref:Uncharacterized protein n=1 Tax=Babesia duncani TaxID=323732 RepID=A0AAD9UPQ5_9APIC|nr:hypothetical protein BdWA1_000123 [Babesia duncani]